MIQHKIFEEKCPPHLFGFLRLFTGVLLVTVVLVQLIFDPLRHSVIQYIISFSLFFLCMSMVTGIFAQVSAFILAFVLGFLAHQNDTLSQLFLSAPTGSFGKPAYCAVLSYICMTLSFSRCETTFRFFSESNDYQSLVPAWPLYLLRFHIIFVYLWTAIFKLAPDFFSGAILQQAYMLYFVGSENFFQKAPSLLIFKFAGYLTIAIEFTIPLALLFFKKQRHIVIAFAIGFHLLLVFFLPTIGFLLTMIIGLLAFLDPKRFPEKVKRAIRYE
jgi:hypothetical protein